MGGSCEAPKRSDEEYARMGIKTADKRPLDEIKSDRRITHLPETGTTISENPCRYCKEPLEQQQAQVFYLWKLCWLHANCYDDMKTFGWKENTKGSRELGF